MVFEGNQVYYLWEKSIFGLLFTCFKVVFILKDKVGCVKQPP